MSKKPVTASPRVDPPFAKRTRKIIVVGGGYTGACAAIALVRRSAFPLKVTLIDPAQHPGAGLAYSAIDLDHRLNGLAHMHTAVVDDAGHFARWCLASNLREKDPQALLPDGRVYARRADFGRYMQQTLQAHQKWPATGSTIHHLRSTAVSISQFGDPLAVHTADAQVLHAELILAATGNPPPRLPPPFAAALAHHPAVIDNALDTERLYHIEADSRVLLVGASLTALDVLSTLMRRGHRGEILVLSRRGLRPRPQAPAQTGACTLEDFADLPASVALDRLSRPTPPYLSTVDGPLEVRNWLRGLRREIARVQAHGGNWYQAFDEMRDVVWRTWPTLPAAQKRRFLGRLRTWYDVHRFRSPPQNDALVTAAAADGRIRFLAASLQSAAVCAIGGQIEISLIERGSTVAQIERFDRVINCTGLDALAGLSSNPFLSALDSAGWIRPDASGIGFDVDSKCRAIGRHGRVQPQLRLLGPPTLGHFGDTGGAMYIAGQIDRIVPGVLRELAEGDQLSA